jgi:hypothetical protein
MLAPFKRDYTFYELEVAEEIDIPHASINTIRTAARSLNYHRVTPTKKLAITPIQKAQRYEITLSRKD